MDEGHWWPVSLMYDCGIRRIKESGIRLDGVLWYQGESNATTCVAPDTPTPEDYQLETLRALVDELRFPFPSSRMPSVLPAKAMSAAEASAKEDCPSPVPAFIMMGLPRMSRPWEPYRAAQKRVCDETGAIFVDTFAAGLGDMNDVHPRDKIPFAELAINALQGEKEVK